MPTSSTKRRRRLRGKTSDETAVAARLTEASQTSLDETLRRLTTNERLRQVLAARLPLIAATRQRTPFLLHALITDFYARGANRIVGGEKPYSRFSGSASKPWEDNS